jgi:hypothetical protein
MQKTSPRIVNCRDLTPSLVHDAVPGSDLDEIAEDPKPTTDGTTLLTAADDGWARFSPRGDQLLVASGGDNAWLHTFESTALPVENLRSTAHVLGGHHIDAHSQLIPLERLALSNAWWSVLGGK